MKHRLTLPTDSTVRKSYQLVAGLDGYFPAALAGVATHSYKSNEKHNKGQPLHWSMDKSNDHAECVRRHLLDLSELLATFERPGEFIQGDVQDAPTVEDVLDEVNALAWRALALSQVLHMQLAGAPQPFNARRSIPEAMQVKEPAPDANCVTLGDGSCVGNGCMHDASPPKWTPACDTTEGPCRCGAWHGIR